MRNIPVQRQDPGKRRPATSVGDEAAGARRSSETLLSDLRGELRRVRVALDRIDAQLQALQQSATQPAPPQRERPERYYLVLVGVLEHGPHGVSPERFAEIGRAHGYDRRGLGGYFAGQRAPLCHEGERVRLTVEGDRLVRGYLGSVVG